MRVIVVLLLSLVVYANAFACKCLPMTWEEETTVSEKIFHGKVVAVNDYRFAIEVLEIWKGEFASNKFQLVQGATSCTSRVFAQGEEYLFYVNGNEVSNCSRTAIYHRTSDPELLNAKLKGIGNLLVIQSDLLTKYQQSILGNLMQQSESIWPTDLNQTNLRFAIDDQYVKKLDFLDVVQRGSGSIQLTKIKIGNSDVYLLWQGSNWKKAQRILKKKG